MCDFTESPFPPEVLNLHYRLQNAETPEEQAALIEELAELSSICTWRRMNSLGLKQLF
jgi:hypothetical protein